MKQRMVKLTAAFLLILLLPGILLLRGAMLPGFYQDSYYAVLPRMQQRLEQTEGKKLVIVGGSNVAFGLDGALLEQLLAQKGFEYTVCPFGLYAAVETGAMLDLSADTLGEGDIVILAVEPTSETMSEYFGATAFWKCAEEAPGLLLKLSKARQAAVTGNYLSYLQERLAIEASGTYPAAQGVYAAASFNDRCDLTYDRPGNVMPLGYDTASPVALDAVRISPAFAGQVNDYCARARKAGAQVVLSFSPVNRSALADDGVEAFFTRCNQTFDCPAISDPNRYILESGWFYDSNFHLNSAGARLRTILLAQDLLVYLGCSSELETALPEMPKSAAEFTESAGDVEAFTYEAVAGGGLIVSGLTDSGAAKTALTVPSAVEGKPVVGFLPGALDGGALVELRLPQSIESLPQGLFRNCEKLERLILVFGGVYLLAWGLGHWLSPGWTALSVSGGELTVVLTIGITIFAVSNLSFYSKNNPFVSSYAQEIMNIRTLVDFAGNAVLIAYFVQCRQMQALKELTAMQTVLENHYAQYRLSRDTIELIDRKYHDLKHLFAALRAEPDAAVREKWLQAMEEDIRSYEIQNKTGHHVLDTVLTGKSLYCQKHGIELLVVADGKLLEFMDVMDICTVFGNALDNAIECELKIPEKSRRIIRLMLSAQKRFLLLQVENYCPEPPKFRGGLPVSTKGDHANHGFGLKSIRATAEKYGGTMTAGVEDGWFVLKMLIPLKNK